MSDKIDKKKVRRTSIGGQAVLEGVMMRGEHSQATAVRSPSGEITVESQYIKSPKERNIFFRLPFVRGVVNLVTQLVAGTGLIMRSAEVYGDFEEPSKFEKWMADKFKVNPMNILMTVSVLLGLVLAVGIFVLLPNILASLICNHTAIQDDSLYSFWYSLIEGGIMLVIFISYILGVSLIKDIRRVFMYHGAEHKVISCYEHGLELTVENAKKMKREHSRCGTTFMFFTVAISIIVFVLINFMLDKCGLLVGDGVTAAKLINALIRLAFKLLFLPVVAGVSYEVLKLLAKSDALPVRILRAPGMALQLITTREPTDDMLEVSITAFKTVQQMDADPTLKTSSFDVSVPYAVARKRVKELIPDNDESDIDWIFVEALKVKRSELATLGNIKKESFELAQSIARKMQGHRPLQYVLGYADFLGERLTVSESVLIPRPETEELALEAVRAAEDYQNVRVLDMCTGSGAIAITISKRLAVNVVATDVSVSAVEVARANALLLSASLDLRVGDMWAALGEEEKFDVIVCNPPYIPSGDIGALDANVREYEPMLALDGSEDGLKFYRIIADGLGAHLSEGGVLLMEFGIGQQDSISRIFSAYDVEIKKDIEGVPRIAIVRGRSTPSASEE